MTVHISLIFSKQKLFGSLLYTVYSPHDDDDDTTNVLISYSLCFNFRSQ